MDYKTSEDLFFELMELPLDERMAALNAIEIGNPSIKEEVIRLLQDAAAADDYFTGTAVAVKMMPKASHASMESIGDMVGPYQLVRKLGEGGFGVVWQADQSIPLKRTVAVKVIKAGMDTDEVLARFDAEKHALARMNHINIAKVLDAGMTETGRPYFAMELVEGRTITQYCADESLTTQDKLRLYMDVCAAVNHAHQKGVIHRDIKPSNVLVVTVELKPVVKVIDFGIAKAIDGELTDHTLRTKAEQWIGTPAYMSPEQASVGMIDLDTRSDIYALGVILYEMITGAPPFDPSTLIKAGYEEMRRIIREEEPLRPSIRITTQSKVIGGKSDPAITSSGQTIKSIASELDWIVMKAMDKSKERRYDTAAALGDDVGRFLSNQPIEARPPSMAYLLTKFAKRHRRAMSLMLLFAFFLIGAAIISSWLALRAIESGKLAEKSLLAAVQERNAKDDALKDSEAVSGLLAEVFQRPQPGLDGRKVTLVDALDGAVRKLDIEMSMQPQRRALLYGVLAETYERLGIFDRAFDLREKSYQILSKYFASDHEQPKTALRKLIEVAESMGNGKVALQYATIENALLREINASGNEIETSMRSIVRAHFCMGDRAMAISQQRTLLEYCIRTFGKESAQDVRAGWELNQYEARELNSNAKNLGQILKLESDLAELIGEYGEEHQKSIEVRMDLAEKLYQAGYTLESLIQLQVLQPMTMKIFGPHDDRMLNVQRMLVMVFVTLGRPIDAVRLQQAIVGALRERDGNKASSTVQEENHLEQRLFYAGLPVEYRNYCEELYQRRRELFGEEHPYTLRLAITIETDNPQEDTKRYQNAVGVMKKIHGVKSRHTAEAIAKIARSYADEKRMKEAMTAYGECAPYMLDDTWINCEYATLQIWTGDIAGFRQTRLNILGYWHKDVGLMRQDAELLERALWLSSIADFDDDNQKAIVRTSLNQVRRIRNELSTEAEDRHSIALQKQFQGIILYRLGDYQDALESLRHAEELMNKNQRHGADFQLSREVICFFKAMTEHRLGNTEEARTLFKLGESTLRGKPPDLENPFLPYYSGGSAHAKWISYREAKLLIEVE